jgi:hypothetical protein
MTHERELTDAVDLCNDDGTLNPDALGWSRDLLVTANLTGFEGRNKKWDYWAILAGDLVLSVTYADIDYLAFADIWWADLATGASGGTSIGGFEAEGFSLPDDPGMAPLFAREDEFDLVIVDDDECTQLLATFRDIDGTPSSLDITVDRPLDLDTLNVVIPWSDSEFNFTSKQVGRPAHGTFVRGGAARIFGGSGDDAWGVLDVGRGRWPAEITWNWGAGAGRVDGRKIGLQVGGRWTVGSGFTENGVFVDGVLTKIGTELDWTYDWDRPLDRWRVVDPEGMLDITLSPRHDKHTQLGGEGDPAETHQVFGTWSGFLVTDDGERIEFDGLQGFAEEARQIW